MNKTLRALGNVSIFRFKNKKYAMLSCQNSSMSFILRIKMKSKLLGMCEMITTATVNIENILYIKTRGKMLHKIPLLDIVVG